MAADDRAPPPNESNAFARKLRGDGPPSHPRLRFALGLMLSLVLAACFTLALLLFVALVVRGVRHGDYRALGAAIAVAIMTVIMARGRRAKKG
jgi:hypothetical protein